MFPTIVDMKNANKVLKLEKSNLRKWQNITFTGPFIAKKMFL